MSDDFNTEVVALETPNLILRRLELTDTEAVFACASDPEVVRYVLWPRHQSLQDSREFVVWLNSSKVCSWAIIEKDTGGVIGIVFLHSLNRRHRRAEIAFHVARPHWGKGHATARFMT